MPQPSPVEATAAAAGIGSILCPASAKDVGPTELYSSACGRAVIILLCLWQEAVAVAADLLALRTDMP